MQSLDLVTATIEADAAEFRVDPLDHPELDNIVVSACGTRIETFDYDGNHFVIDWDEISPPGDTEGADDREDIPHEQFMEELDQCIGDEVDFSPPDASAIAALERLVGAIESLRESPVRCPVVGVKNGLTFRQLIVDRQFFVYYVYYPPSERIPEGMISIRSVKHPADRDQFFEILEVLAGDPLQSH